MSGFLLEKRLAENEVVFSKHNKSVISTLEKSIDSVNLDQPFDHFYCECSSAYCMERISIAPTKYQTIHENKKRFIIKPGHETPSIERIVQHKPAYLVVEKFLTPPDPGESKLNT